MPLARKVKNFVSAVFFTPMPLQEFANYDEYWEMRPPPDKPLFRYRFIANELSNEGTLLDIGCGDGRFLSHLQKVRPGIMPMGIDGSSKAVEKVRDLGIRAEVCDIADGSLCSFGDHFDYIVIMEVIEHLPYPEKVMRQIRQLNPRYCYVTIPNLGFIVHRLRLALGGRTPLTTIQFHIREHLRFWTVKDFKYWVHTLGFEVVECCGQHDSAFRRMFSSLLCAQMVYRLKPTDANTH